MMGNPVNLTIVQFQPRKGDYAGNLERFEQLFETLMAVGTRPDIIAFSETVLTGYFVEGGVRDVALPATTFAKDLNRAFRVHCKGQVDVVAGFYELHENTYFNSAMYVTLGGDDPIIAHVHRKLFLPTYGLFDEERFVEHGLGIRAFDTRWGRAALLICEDAWHAVTATAAALDGAQIIFVPSASPARGAWPQPDEEMRGPASMHRWERLARDRAEEHGVFVAVIQLTGNEGGKAFPGGSVVAGPEGDIRARAPLWDEASIAVTLDLQDITRARASSPLLADLRTMLPHMLRSLQRAGERE
ncbi:MAG TPA: nitrilase-related carbon-nitrogen hydrolase [Gemmatimonadaceae bacterium]|jgi:predicted amidohydrolase